MLLDMQGGWKTEERGGIEVNVCDYWVKSSSVSSLGHFICVLTPTKYTGCGRQSAILS